MQGFDDAFGSEGGGEGVGALVVPQGIHSLLRMATLGVRASGVGASGVGASGVGASIAFPSSALFTTPPFGFGNPTVPTSDALWYECNSGASAAGSVVSSSSIDEDEARKQRPTSSERTKARRRMSQAAANEIRAVLKKSGAAKGNPFSTDRSPAVRVNAGNKVLGLPVLSELPQPSISTLMMANL